MKIVSPSAGFFLRSMVYAGWRGSPGVPIGYSVADLPTYGWNPFLLSGAVTNWPAAVGWLASPPGGLITLPLSRQFPAPQDVEIRSLKRPSGPIQF